MPPERRPDGYISKDEAASKLGVSIKTLDRRLGAGDLAARTLRAGRSIWLRATDVDAFFQKVQARGYV